jgi:hypothetical protein
MSINSRELLVVPRVMTSDNHRLRRGGLGRHYIFQTRSILVVRSTIQLNLQIIFSKLVGRQRLP